MQRPERSRMIGFWSGWRQSIQGFWSDELPVARHITRALAIPVYPMLWAAVWLIAKHDPVALEAARKRRQADMDADV